MENKCIIKNYLNIIKKNCDSIIIELKLDLKKICYKKL